MDGRTSSYLYCTDDLSALWLSAQFTYLLIIIIIIIIIAMCAVGFNHSLLSVGVDVCMFVDVHMLDANNRETNRDRIADCFLV